MKRAMGLLALVLVLFIGCSDDTPAEKPIEPDPFSLMLPIASYEAELDATWPFELPFTWEEPSGDAGDHRVTVAEGVSVALSQFYADRSTIDYITIEIQDEMSREEIERIAAYFYGTVDDRERTPHWDEVFFEMEDGGMYYEPPYRLDLVFDEAGHYAEVHINTAAVE